MNTLRRAVYEPRSPHPARHGAMTSEELQNQVMSLVEPIRAEDGSPLMAEMVLDVCRLLARYRHPAHYFLENLPPHITLSSPSVVVLGDGATCVAFERLSPGDYTTVATFLDDVVVEDLEGVRPDSNPANPQARYRVVYVREAFDYTDPIKRHVEEKLGLEGGRWLDELLNESLAFREWWQALGDELMDKLRCMPIDAAIQWQGFKANRLKDEAEAKARAQERHDRGDHEAARNLAGDGLIRQMRRWLSDDHYFDDTNVDHLFTSLEAMAKAEGEDRVAAALVVVPIPANQRLSDEIRTMYPYPPVTSRDASEETQEGSDP